MFESASAFDHEPLTFDTSSVTDMGYTSSVTTTGGMFRVHFARALTPQPSDVPIRRAYSQGLYAGAAAGGAVAVLLLVAGGAAVFSGSKSVAPRGVRWSASLLRARDQRHAQHIRKREITVHTDARGCVLRTSRPSSMEGRLPTPFCLDSPGTRIAPGARSRIHRIPDDLLHVAEFGCQS